jgi:hypothetical protein
MAQNHSELIFLVPWFILLVIAISMLIQGWMIVHETHGYQENPIAKGHPEMKGFKKGDGLLVVRFTDEDLQELQKRVLQQKIDELFEEPSTYEDEESDN